MQVGELEMIQPVPQPTKYELDGCDGAVAGPMRCFERWIEQVRVKLLGPVLIRLCQAVEAAIETGSEAERSRGSVRPIDFLVWIGKDER